MLLSQNLSQIQILMEQLITHLHSLERRQKVAVGLISHTCPYKYTPTEAFLPMVNQDDVDNSTEQWLDEIEETVQYRAWLCGHWHINKRVDFMWFLFDNAIDSEEILERGRNI